MRRTSLTRSPDGRRRLVWWRRIAVAMWLFSWYTIYCEIFVWHHMTTSLRFNPPPVPPGVAVQPRAGLSLIAVCITSILAPALALAFTVALRRQTSHGETSGD